MCGGRNQRYFALHANELCTPKTFRSRPKTELKAEADAAATSMTPRKPLSRGATRAQRVVLGEHDGCQCRAGRGGFHGGPLPPARLPTTACSSLPVPARGAANEGRTRHWQRGLGPCRLTREGAACSGRGPPPWVPGGRFRLTPAGRPGCGDSERRGSVFPLLSFSFLVERCAFRAVDARHASPGGWPLAENTKTPLFPPRMGGPCLHGTATKGLRGCHPPFLPPGATASFLPWRRGCNGVREPRQLRLPGVLYGQPRGIKRETYGALRHRTWNGQPQATYLVRPQELLLLLFLLAPLLLLLLLSRRLPFAPLHPGFLFFLCCSSRFFF